MDWEGEGGMEWEGEGARDGLEGWSGRVREREGEGGMDWRDGVGG
jgi:hypothetical protein